MTFLCVCAGGNIRSRAFAHHLMYRLGHEALSASHDKQSDGTFVMLCEWADRIILAQQKYIERIPEKYRGKVKVLDVGPDEYGSPWHFLLQAQVQRLMGEWALTGFEIGGAP